MSETVQVALIAAGIPACITLILYGARFIDWAVTRWERRREARAVEEQRQRDQEEARKTTRVLLETIELKNQELAMKDRIIDDLLRLLEAVQFGSRR